MKKKMYNTAPFLIKFFSIKCGWIQFMYKTGSATEILENSDFIEEIRMSVYTKVL